MWAMWHMVCLGGNMSKKISVENDYSNQYERLLYEASIKNNMIVLKGSLGDPCALGLFEVEGGLRWFRVFEVRQKQLEIESEENLNLESGFIQ